MKVCNKCKIKKEYLEFSKHKCTKDGFRNTCKLCCKEYKLKNKLKFKEYSKNYYINNKEIICINSNNWKIKNFHKVKEYHKNNRTKRNNYELLRKKSDSLYKLICNIRSLINICIKKQGYTKKSNTYKMLGCTYEEFKEHLEKQFIDGMTWENYGKWHLDHIIPISSAKTEEDIIKLNNYTNFQPLWAVDNIRKGNKTQTKQ